VIQDTAVDTSSVDVAIKFKKDVVELVSIEAGEAWQDATGADSAELEAMVDAANESGELSNVTFLYTGGDSAPAGESTVFSMNMRGRDGQDGTSDIELVSVEMVDADGNDIPTTLENGEVVVGSGGGGGSSNSMLWVVIALVAVGLVGGGGYVVWRRRKAWA
jgi:LPXTG-motif cell wall-anchored protein